MDGMKTKRMYYGWVNLAVLWIVNLLCTVPLFYTFGVIVADMAGELHMSMTVATAAYTLHTVILSLIAPLHGQFVRRYGVKASFLLGQALGCAAYLCFALFTKTVAVYYLLWMIPVSVCMRFSGSYCSQMTVSKWFLKHRGMAMGLFFASGGVGGYLLAPLLNGLRQIYGWRGVWLFLAAACALCFLLVLVFLREHPAEDDKADEFAAPAPGKASHAYRTAEQWRYQEVLRSRSFYIILLIFILSQFTMYAVCNTGILYLAESGMERALAASAIGWFALISTVGRLLVGFFSDRVNMKLLVAAGCGFCLAGMLLFARITSAAELFVAVALLGVGYGVVMVAPVNLLLDYYGTYDDTNTISWYSMISGCIAALFSVLFGWIYDCSHSYAPVWSIGAGLAVLCLISALVVTPPRRKKA